MKRKVSNSMSIENDPHFDVYTPICLACKNFVYDKGICKIYDKEESKKYRYCQKYDCLKKCIDVNSKYYKDIKDNLN